MRKDNIMRIRTASLLGAAALSVSACAASNGAYRPGYAYGYGSPDAFGCSNGAYDGYGVYGLGYCGWYDGFFYPGFGNFVFDRHHHRREMTSRQHGLFHPPGGSNRQRSEGRARQQWRNGRLRAAVHAPERRRRRSWSLQSRRYAGPIALRSANSGGGVMFAPPPCPPGGSKLERDALMRWPV
jgi:hypothetical protein